MLVKIPAIGGWLKNDLFGLIILDNNNNIWDNNIGISNSDNIGIIITMVIICDNRSHQQLVEHWFATSNHSLTYFN